MADVEERLGRVEERLTSVQKSVEEMRSDVGGLRDEVGGLRSEVGGLRDEVGGLRGEVGELRTEGGTLRDEVGGLRGDVQKYRVVAERTATDVQLVMEVQSRHGERLDEHGRLLERIVSGDIAPFRDLRAVVLRIAANTAPLRDFMERIAQDHEARITNLEKRTGIRE